MNSLAPIGEAKGCDKRNLWRLYREKVYLSTLAPKLWVLGMRMLSVLVMVPFVHFYPNHICILCIHHKIVEHPLHGQHDSAWIIFKGYYSAVNYNLLPAQSP